MGAARRFVDSDGFAWQVVEVRPEDQRGGAQGWLYFFSREVTRSLASYPDDWPDLGWQELERLCRRASAPGTRTAAVPAREHARERVSVHDAVDARL